MIADADMTVANHVELQHQANSDSTIKASPQDVFNNSTATMTRYIHIKQVDTLTKIFRETTV